LANLGPPFLVALVNNSHVPRSQRQGARFQGSGVSGQWTIDNGQWTMLEMDAASRRWLL